jgi:hypothetical protein
MTDDVTIFKFLNRNRRASALLVVGGIIETASKVRKGDKSYEIHSVTMGTISTIFKGLGISTLMILIKRLQQVQGQAPSDFPSDFPSIVSLSDEPSSVPTRAPTAVPSSARTGAPQSSEIPECYDTILALTERMKSLPAADHKQFVLCPNTRFDIGFFFDEGTNCCTGGDLLLSPANNTRIQCGESGSSSGNCSLNSGEVQLIYFGADAEDTPNQNVTIVGITFTNASYHMNLLAAPGDITFIDCVFKVSTASPHLSVGCPRSLLKSFVGTTTFNLGRRISVEKTFKFCGMIRRFLVAGLKATKALPTLLEQIA